MTAPSWAPFPQQVANYVTSRTVDYIGTPGSDEPAQTFTTTTTPSLEQVQGIIADACAWVTAVTGPIDPTLETDAAGVASLRAAGMVELSYPIRNAEIDSVANPLLLEAFNARAELVNANRSVGVAVPGSAAMPSFRFPTPEAWRGNEPSRYGVFGVW